MDKKLISIFVTLILTINFVGFIATASPVDDAGEYMVKRGNDLFVYGIGDSMISLANGGNTSINRTEIPDMTMKTLTYSVDPYQFQFVQEWQNTMLVFYVLILILIVIVGAAIAHKSKTNPEIIQRIYWITKNPKVIALDNYISLIVTGIALLVFGIFGMFYLLKLEYITNALITNHALTTAPSLIDNMIAYFFMSLSYLILSIVMAIRNIIILTVVSGQFGMFALYLIGLLAIYSTKSIINFAISAFMYFIVILFMQPLLLFVSAIGLAFIKILPPELMPIEVLTVVGLFLVLSGISISCLFAAGIIKNIVYIRG